MSEQEKNIQTASDYLKAISDNDTERQRSLEAPDMVFVAPESLPHYGGRFAGPERLAELSRLFAPHWPEWDERPIQSAAVGDYVFVLMEQSGTTSIGNDYRAPSVTVYRFNDQGLIREAMAFPDTALVRRVVLGADATDGRA